MPYSESPAAESVHRIGLAEWAATLDALPVPTLGIDRDGLIVAANQAAAQLLECPRHTLLGMSVDTLVPSAARGQHRARRESFPRGAPPRLMTVAPEVPLRRPNGDELYVKIGLGSIALRDGDFVLATLTDQTTRHALHLRTQQVFETSPAVICMWQQHPDGRVTMPFASPSVEPLYGVTRAELARSAEVILQRIHPDDRARVAESLAASARDLSPWRCTYRIVANDPAVRWLEAHAMPSREPDGTVSWVGSVLDVSERHLTEALIAETRAQLDNALEAARAYTFMIDFGTGKVHYDARAPVLFGVNPEVLANYTVDDLGSLTHPDDRPLVRAQLARVLTGTETRVTLTHRLRRDDGVYATFSIRARVERDADGRPLRLYGAGADVTQEHLAVSALRQSEARFRQLAENIREVFWLANRHDGSLEYVSPAFETIWGRSCAELYANRWLWFEAVHPDDQARVRAATDGAADRGYHEEYRIVRPDGAVRWIRDQAFPVRGPDGAVHRVAGVAEDYTERRELEAQLRQTQKMESVGLLAGGIAHDFNNWITVIASNCELMLEALSEAGPRDLVEEVLDAAQRASSLTRQLLAFSRRQVVEPRVVSLAAVISDTEKLLRRLLGEDVSLRSEITPTTWPVLVDPGLVVQVLMNLAVNARDAMPRGGTLTLSLRNVTLSGSDPGRPAGEWVVLSASDTGEGIAPDVITRIFEPFFTTKAPGRGTGLGLSVVHGIVAQSGGFITVESIPGAGAAFHIHFPASEEVAAAGRESVATGSGGQETVLLVEDEDIVRRVTSRLLRKHGYRVREAADATQALSMLDPKVDLLLTDVVMPDVDGFTLCAEARQRRPGLRVLFTSGYTDDRVAPHGDALADATFLPKPFTQSLLLRKVREVLDAR
ncbi:MAG: PAS domain-containing protein [Polyangiales bacterium]